MVLVGCRSISVDTDPDSGSRLFLYGSVSREMIWIPWIRIRHTDVADPYFFAGAGSELFSSDPSSGSERGPVQNQIKSRILYLYPNLKVSNPPDGKKTQLFYLRLRSVNLKKFRYRYL